MKTGLLLIFLLAARVVNAQVLQLPSRQSDAPTGRAFATSVSALSRDAREEAIFQQIIAGNVPAFMRNLVPITVNATSHTLVYYVIPDYLAVGSDEDYFLMPMTPLLAQRIADTTGCSLPTKKMVDQVYQSAFLKLSPKPIPPSAAMITIPVFAQHNDSVWQQRQPVLAQFPLGSLVGGDKKDVIISNAIYTNLKPTVPKPVVIYGWHQLNGVPIQPVYNGHEESYADYSHGIRLVQRAMTLDGSPAEIAALLKDPALCGLISDEGIIAIPRYGSPVGILAHPRSFGILQNSPTSLRIVWEERPATQYYAYTSADDLAFRDSLVITGGSATIGSLQTDSICYVRLRAFRGDSTSLPSEILAAVPSAAPHTVLIVNGFDRATTGNTYDFIRQHGRAIHTNDRPFSSATNDAVVSGLVPLSGFTTADYILGTESTADETFSTTEQESVSVFLRRGGSLFVSGAEIGWDIDFKGSTTDQTFFHQYLKARYVADNPSSGPGIVYAVTCIPGGIFDGMPVIQFDNGTHGTYNVQYPDVVSGNDGGLNCLQYLNDLTGAAGVTFAGVFPQGSAQGNLVYLGFPFETILGDSVRTEFMRRILAFFSTSTGIGNPGSHLPGEFSLSQNYPNPFNPTTVVSIQLPVVSDVTLAVYDALGREVAVLINERKVPGRYEVTFDGSGLSSGVYFYRLVAGSYTNAKRMILLK